MPMPRRMRAARRMGMRMRRRLRRTGTVSATVAESVRALGVQISRQRDDHWIQRPDTGQRKPPTRDLDKIRSDRITCGPPLAGCRTPAPRAAAAK
jgi:hypothetical protein